MADVNPERWKSVADLPSNSYVDGVYEYIRKMMTDIAVAESNDIRAALAVWGDIEAEHLMRIKYHADGPQVSVDHSKSMFTQSPAGKLVVEVPRLIVVADIRRAGTANPDNVAIAIDWRIHERTFEGERYTIALLHRDETAKIPGVVRTATEPIDFQPGMDD